MPSDCCSQGFRWGGTPEGNTIAFPTSSNQAYVTGSGKDVAVLLISDGFGWKYPNIRLLADHFAKELQATVYVPDFFGGETLDWDAIENERYDEIDLPAFLSKNARDVREPEIFACAKKLRSDFRMVGAVGYCYGGWAAFRLGANGVKLVDCISVGHPSLLTEEDINNVEVPTQLLAPEIDPEYTERLKQHTWKKLQEKDLAFDYQHFPRVQHGCLIRGSTKVENERDAMVRGKNAVVAWFRQWLQRS